MRGNDGEASHESLAERIMACQRHNRQVIDRSYIVETANDRYLDPDFRSIWGGFTLNQGEELRGHIVFEAPLGSEFSDFRWLAGDTAVVRYD